MRKNFITIGSFDGVHTGHKFLLARLKTLAQQNGMNPLILAFPYPPRVLAGEQRDMSIITTPQEKFEIIKSLKAGEVQELDFNAIKDTDSGDFFNILLSKYNMGGIIVGRDFAMGKNRNGHLDFLRKACADNNVIYEQEDFVMLGGHKISSSLIRRALHDGDIEAANKMLSRPYSLSGEVVKGRQLGRTIGFPTANMAVDPHKILPRGIYAVWVNIGKEIFKGVCSVGLRPTVEKNGALLTEVHILDFNRDIYGREITIKFAAKIRDEVKFNSLGDLTQQINKDAICAYKILK